MTRVLQIRRGTTAQNDNFTGMAGEITYDTDAKTIRVHDGATLGGVALARADQVPTVTPFDIDSVTDAKWAEIVARVTPAAYTVATGSALNITNTTYISYCFAGISTTPFIVRAILVCQNDAAGYTTGDETDAFGIGSYASPIFNTVIDENGLNVRMAVGNQTFWVAHKSTGAATDIANADWKIKFRIYC